MGRREINEALKAQAVAMVVSEGLSVRQVCELLGVGATAVRRWVDQWRAEHEGPPPTPEQVNADQRRIRELEAQVSRLEGERELLKKSIAFFVRDNDRRTR
jgi:transposase